MHLGKWAIVFNYLVDNRVKMTATQRAVVLNGLYPKKKYTVKEINLYPETTLILFSDKEYPGDF